VVVSSHRLSTRKVLIVGDLNQPPRLRRLRNGAIFFMAQPPLLSQGGESRVPNRFPNLHSSAFAKEGE
jgi:hypothetical protein